MAPPESPPAHPPRTLDPEQIRADFPILSASTNGKRLVYLDSAATTQKPEAVITALADFYRKRNATVHRGVYPLGEAATALYEAARTQVARFLNAPAVRGVIFTRNATEAVNLAAHAWARHALKAGDEILISDLEHHANIVPWYLLAKERGVRLRAIPTAPDCAWDMDAFAKLLTPKVKLVAVTAMSNVTATTPPIAEITAAARRAGAAVLVDGAQWVAHRPTDVQAMGCDFLVFSAHKMLGPTGVGVLWAGERVLAEMRPFLGGGEMIETVALDHITFAPPPLQFEAGTPNIADTAAFPVALDYLGRLGWEAITAHERSLAVYARERLLALPNIVLYGQPHADAGGTAIAFNHTAVHAHDVGTILAEEGVAIRVGHHCAQPLMRKLGVAATARASFYVYNTREDVDALIAALARVDAVFGRVRGR